jgi:hypothetical protein
MKKALRARNALPDTSGFDKPLLDRKRGHTLALPRYSSSLP